MSEKVLSICIPTYKRHDVLYTSINNILECKDDRFEIVVCDNSEDNDALDTLKKINDKRLSLYCNEVNIGFVNVTKVLTLGSGKYSMILLDKDGVDAKSLSAFIDTLETLDVACGFVDDNNKLSTPQIFDQGIASILRMTYGFSHPSGKFFNTELIKSSKIANDIISNLDSFSYPLEIINIELCRLKNNAVINLPLIIREPVEQVVGFKTISFTDSNLYVLPANTKKRLVRYIDTLKEFGLNKNIPILKKICNAHLVADTIAYRCFMADPILTSHYCCDMQSVSIGYLIRAQIKLIPFHWGIMNDLSALYRIFVLSYVNMKFVLQLAKWLLKRSIVKIFLCHK